MHMARVLKTSFEDIVVDSETDLTKCYCNYILFITLLCDQETRKGPFGGQVKVPPTHLSTTLVGLVEASRCLFY